jgi:hypothetical protein
LAGPGDATPQILLVVYSTVSPTAGLVALTDQILDYAGLFPPAALNMAASVDNYAIYRHASPHTRAVLGCFVLPANRLGEFSINAAHFLAHDADPPWRLTVLGGPDPAADARVIAEFSALGAGRAVVDSIEVKATTEAEIASTVAAHGRRTCYVELSPTGDWTAALGAIARAGARAKIRTGGLVASAFPSSMDIALFFVACLEAGIAFKATAGLHHPFTGNYRLTYEPTSPFGRMHGFVNLFLTAAFVREGMSIDTAVALLSESNRDTFTFDAQGAAWKTHRISVDAIRAARTHFANAFGSCSFHEPIDELTTLGLL